MPDNLCLIAVEPWPKCKPVTLPILYLQYLMKGIRTFWRETQRHIGRTHTPARSTGDSFSRSPVEKVLRSFPEVKIAVPHC